MDKELRQSKGYVFKNLFLERLKQLPKDITLCLSGGIDSSCILYGLLYLNKPPKECVTFQLENFPESLDIKETKRICNIFNIPLIIAKIPTDKDSIIKEVINILTVTQKSLKTHVHSCYPLRYMTEASTTKNLVLGTWSDTILYYENKHVNMARLTLSSEDFTKFYWEERLGRWYYKDHSFFSMKKWVESLGCTYYEPYYDPTLFYYSLGLDFYEWHRDDNDKGLKQLMVMLFKDYFDKVGGSRTPLNMQNGNYIKEAHAILLKDSTLNHRNNIDLYAVYNNMLNDIKTGQQKII
jgi:hypothetical protein